MNHPLVSVILPIRNAERYLDEAIRSVLAQTFRDFELLLIDDFSDDRSPDIAHNYSLDDARIHVFRNPHRGLIGALNYGISSARGAFIARMDADDICAPMRFARQLRILQNNPTMAVLGSAVQMIDENGNILGEIHHPTQPCIVNRTLLQRCCIVHPSTMMRTEVVRAVGGYRAAFVGSEDYDLWLRIAEQAKLSNLDELLLRYRWHEGQATWGGIEQRIFSELTAVAGAMRRRAGQPDGIAASSVIDRQFAISSGVEENVLEQQLLRRSLGTAIDALRLRQYRVARMALDLALRQPSMPLRVRMRCLWLQVRLAGKARSG